MNNVKLGKKSLGFVLAAAATFTVNANNVTPNVTTIENTAEVGGSFSLNQIDFSKLLSVFDIDNNGALSKAELSTSDNETLKSAFKSIDINEDASISADEFRAFGSVKAN
jgi:Ca2+-binding EF-hand superfamily protein